MPWDTHGAILRRPPLSAKQKSNASCLLRPPLSARTRFKEESPRPLSVRSQSSPPSRPTPSSAAHEYAISSAGHGSWCGLDPWHPSALRPSERRAVEPPWWEVQVAGITPVNHVSRCRLEAPPLSAPSPPAEETKSEEKKKALKTRPVPQLTLQSFKMRQISRLMNQANSAKCAKSLQSPAHAPTYQCGLIARNGHSYLVQRSRRCVCV